MKLFLDTIVIESSGGDSLIMIRKILIKVLKTMIVLSKDRSDFGSLYETYLLI